VQNDDIKEMKNDIMNEVLLVMKEVDLHSSKNKVSLILSVGARYEC
jgi:hypothetical protein